MIEKNKTILQKQLKYWNEQWDEFVMKRKASIGNDLRPSSFRALSEMRILSSFIHAGGEVEVEYEFLFVLDGEVRTLGRDNIESIVDWFEEEDIEIVKTFLLNGSTGFPFEKAAVSLKRAEERKEGREKTHSSHDKLTPTHRQLQK